MANSDSEYDFFIEQDSGDEAARLAASNSRVRGFLRQASGIIAAERGLNSVAQQKLQSLAEHLSMPQHEFQRAMVELQEQEELPPGLNRYEQDFVRFLRHEFANLKSGILTVKMENKAISLATRKYQIQEARARQLIYDQAETMDVGRISKSDAEQYVEELISSRIGDSTAIGNEARERFYKIGDKWGVPTDRVDAIILQSLADNRQLLGTGESSNRGLVSTILFLIIVITGAGITSYFRGWFDFSESAPPTTATKTNIGAGVPTIEFSGPVETPEWWKESGVEDLANTVLDRPSNQTIIQALCHPELDERKLGITSLVDLAQNSLGENARDSLELLCQYYYSSPDPQLADEVVKKLRDDLSISGNARVPAKKIKLRKAFDSNRILARLWYFGGAKDDDQVKYRREAIGRTIRNEFGESELVENQVDYLNRTGRVIAIKQWNHLIQTSWSSPNRTSIMISHLVDLSRTRLQTSELQRLHGRTVMATLEAEQSLWQTLRPEIESAIEHSTESAVNNWINHYESITDDEYKSWLGLELADRCKLELRSRSSDEVSTALRDVWTANNRVRYKDLLERNESLGKLNQDALNGPQFSELSPQLIADVAHAVNLNIMLAPQDQNSFRYAEFDELKRKGPPQLEEMSIQAMKNARGQQDRPLATASDIRTKRECLEKLQELPRDKIFARMRAIETLSNVAVRIPDLEYEEAIKLVDYCISERGNRELLNLEKHMARFAEWPTFGLAIVDRMGAAEMDLDRAMTLGQFFFEGNFQVNDPINWKNEIRDAIFSAVVVRTQSETETVTRTSKQWDFLRNYLARSYERRLKAMGVRRMASESPGDLLVQIIHQVSGGLAVEPDFPVDRAIDLVRRGNDSELKELIGLNRILAKLLVQHMRQRWPTRKEQIDGLLPPIDGNESKSLGMQLIDSESVLLRLWSLERISIEDKLISN